MTDNALSVLREALSSIDLDGTPAAGSRRLHRAIFTAVPGLSISRRELTRQIAALRSEVARGIRDSE